MKTFLNLKIKKASTILLLLPLLFLFNNSTNNSINRQNIRSQAFGPTPIAMDGRSIFNLKDGGSLESDNFWKDIRSTFDTLFIHFLYLDYLGHSQEVRPDLVALNENQVQGLIAIQKKHGYKIKIDLGTSLGRNCASSLSAYEVADRASDQDIALLKRFYYTEVSDKNGKKTLVKRKDQLRIDSVLVDGPILRLIKDSKKAISCHVIENGRVVRKGFEEAKAIEITARYFSHIQRKIANLQDGHNPKVGWVINLPNWSVSKLTGEYGVANLNIERAMQSFGRTSFYPGLSEVVLDYPYSYIAANTTAFNTRVKAVSENLRHIRGNPELGVIANTQINMAAAAKMYGAGNNKKNESERGLSCIDKSSQLNFKPLLLVYQGNDCLAGTKTTSVTYTVDGKTTRVTGRFKEEAEAIIEFGDKKYVEETLNYNLLIYNNLPQGTRAHSIYFESWYEFPSQNKVFGAKLINAVPKL